MGRAADFAPNARLVRKLGEDFFIGREYYNDLGTPGELSAFQNQAHQPFAVTDFKVGEIDVDIGIQGLLMEAGRLSGKIVPCPIRPG